MAWQGGCPLVDLVFPLGTQVPARSERSPAADLYSGLGFDPDLARSFGFGER